MNKISREFIFEKTYGRILSIIISMIFCFSLGLFELIAGNPRYFKGDILGGLFVGLILTIYFSPYLIDILFLKVDTVEGKIVDYKEVRGKGGHVLDRVIVKPSNNGYDIKLINYLNDRDISNRRMRYVVEKNPNLELRFYYLQFSSMVYYVELKDNKVI